MRNFHEQRNFLLKTIINHANERVSSLQIQNLFSLFNSPIKTELMYNISIICAKPTPNYEFYISIIKKTTL